MFLVLGGGGFNFNLPNGSNFESQPEKISESVRSFINSHWEVVLILAFLTALIILALIYLRFISKAGLIKTLSGIEKKQKGSFNGGFKEGKKYFWKLIFVSLVLVLMAVGIAIVLIVPVVFLFYLEAMTFGIIAAILAIVIFIPLIILSAFLGRYASLYIILSDLGVKDSLENSYQLFRKNIFPSIIMALFFVPIGIVMLIVILALTVCIGLFFLLLWIVLNLIVSGTAGIVAAAGIIVFVGAVILVSSIGQVFYESIWFLFFKEIASIKKEEMIEDVVEEKEIVEKILPNPEEA